jgi:hypothetical protein
MSANYVDPTNLAQVMNELTLLSGFDEKAKGLKQDLSDDKIQQLSQRLLDLAEEDGVGQKTPSINTLAGEGRGKSSNTFTDGKRKGIVQDEASLSFENSMLNRDHLKWHDFKAQFRQLPSVESKKRQRAVAETESQNSFLDDFSTDWDSD